MSPDALSGAELVVHVFVAADDERADDAFAWLCALWAATKDELRLDAVCDPPCARVPARLHESPLLGFAERDDDGVAQAMVRRAHDVILLSVADAPGPRRAESWRTLDARWDDILKSAEARTPRPRLGVLGSVRIYQGSLAGLGSGTTPLDGATAVRDLVPAARTEPPWDEAGCRVGNGLVAWDTGPTDDADRRLVVLCPSGGDEALSRWTWVHGPSGTTPLTRYLLNTAKIRYSDTVFRARIDDVRRDYHQVDADTAALLRVLDSVDLAVPGDDQIAELLSRCNRISLDLADLENQRRQFRMLRRTVEIAVANRLLGTPKGLPPGPHLFDDDRAAAEVLLARLDDELEYLDAAREGGRDVNAAVRAAADRAFAGLESERRARQERFGLLQTAVIGVLVMVLTAVQSLQYRVPLDQHVDPALIAFLGALALVLGVEMFGRAQPADAGSGRMRWARALSAGLCGAAAGWMLETVVRVQILGHPPDAVLSVVASVVGFVLAGSCLVGARRLTDPAGRRAPTRVSDPVDQG